MRACSRAYARIDRQTDRQTETETETERETKRARARTRERPVFVKCCWLLLGALAVGRFTAFPVSRPNFVMRKIWEDALLFLVPPRWALWVFR